MILNSVIEITLFVDLVVHQPQVSGVMESLETTAIPVEVTSGQVSSCVESLGTTTCTIDNPIEEPSSQRQPVVMLETLDLSR